jgi:DNA-binding LacI/PurR family transcriptional regulator
VTHLAELGHTQIAHVAGAEHFVHARQRQAAWRDAVRAAGLEPGPVVVGDFTYDGGRRAATALLGAGDPVPTAVVCANDLSAIGFMAQSANLGYQIPGHISVTGYDGIELGSYVRPSLTTVRTSPRALGAEAARLLLDVIEGATAESEAAVVTIPAAELLLRESTSPASL